MSNERDDFPKDERGKRLLVFGSMQVEAYVARLRKKHEGLQVCVLPISQAAQVDLLELRRLFPEALLELHPRVTGRVVDLIPTAFVPSLRAPALDAIDLQQEGRDRRAAINAGKRCRI